MTATPIEVSPQCTLAAAQRLMREHAIRHLPVVSEGRLVGLVSERDLHLTNTLPQIDPETMTVDTAMTFDPHAVGPSTPLREVALVMAYKKHGSVVVVEDGQVIGIFTTVDGMQCLADLLGGGGLRARGTSHTPADDRDGTAASEA